MLKFFCFLILANTLILWYNSSMDAAKKEIIKRFMDNVYGKTPNITEINSKHDGKYGHWLETQMGIVHNRSNAPDLLGYEMKNNTSTKTTFGDWSPDDKIWSDGTIDRGDFVKIFGHKSPEPHRWSWSGKPVPKYATWNDYGQTLRISRNNDIEVVYDYKHDKRENKNQIIPEPFRFGENVLMSWTRDIMRKRVESKFNQKGWFKCLTDNDGTYYQIVFGKPFTFEQWLTGVREGKIYLDSGIHDELKPNERPYMSWRADNTYWNSLIQERYP